MKRNYLTYPCKYMRITQNCTGKTSHLAHSQASPADYPFDEGCEGSGKSYMYCPCDSMRVARVYGVEARAQTPSGSKAPKRLYLPTEARTTAPCSSPTPMTTP